MNKRALTIEVADLVVAELNARYAAPGTAEPLQAKRCWMIDIDAEGDAGALNTVRAFVVPAGLEKTIASRRHNENELSVAIGIYRQVATGDDAKVDELVELVEEMAEHFLADGGLVLAGPVNRFNCIKANSDPILNFFDLRELNRFSCISLFTFKITR